MIFLTACTSVENKTELPANNTPSQKEGVSVALEEGDCNLGKYQMGSEVIKF